MHNSVEVRKEELTNNIEDKRVITMKEELQLITSYKNKSCSILCY